MTALGRVPRGWLFSGCLLAVAIVIGAVVWSNSRAADPRFRTVAAQMGDVTQTVDASGTLEPAQQYNLDFGTSGRVSQVNVQPGQQVSQGQSLATLDTSNLQAALSKSEAALSSAEAKANNESANASSTQITQDQDAVQSAQADVNTAQNNLNEATIVSPISGVVGAVNITSGQFASGSVSGSSSGSSGSGSASSSGGSSGGASSSGGGASSSSGGSGSQNPSGTGAVVVISQSSYKAVVSVSDAQIGQVKVGQQVEVTPAGSATPVSGTVTQVSPLATVSSGVATYPVTISINGNPPGLFAGSSTQTSIISNQAQGVLTVPTSAVHTARNRSFVLVMQNGRAVPRAVTLGVSDPTRTEITDGLDPGSQVVIANLNASVPSSSTQNRGLFGGGGGGFGGGGRGGGGFGGGGGARGGG